MTEERKKAVACCPECKLSCWSDNSWECSGCGGRWVKVPKHTDKEYQFRLDDIAVLESVVASQKERIKELEVKLLPKDWKPACYDLRDVYKIGCDTANSLIPWVACEKCPYKEAKQ